MIDAHNYLWEMKYLNHFRRPLIFGKNPLCQIYREEEADRTDEKDKQNNWGSTSSNVKHSSKYEKKKDKQNTDIYSHEYPKNLQK